MKRIISILLFVLPIATTAQIVPITGYEVLKGQGFQKSYSGTDTLVGYVVNNQDSALAALVLVTNGDSAALFLSQNVIAPFDKNGIYMWGGLNIIGEIAAIADARLDTLRALRNGSLNLVEDTINAYSDNLHLKNDAETSEIFNGTINELLFGVLPVAVSGTGTQQNAGTWTFLNYTGADNLENQLGSTMLALGLNDGNYRNFRLDSSSVFMSIGNVMDGVAQLSVKLDPVGYDYKVQLVGSTAEFVITDSLIQPLVVVNRTGNMGIGTNSPDTTLHVVGQIKYVDGNQAAGAVLISDASGNASWQAPASRVLSQDVGSTTTTTDWETLGTYTIAANTLGDDSSTDIAFAMSCTESTDSVLVLFGADTCLFDRANATNGYVANITAYYESAGTIVYANTTEQKVYTGTEDNSGTIAVTFKAKSATIGNQKLEYYRIKLE